MTIIPYLIYLLLVALHVVILKDVTTIYTVPLNLSAFLVLAVTLYKDDMTAIWFGFFAGLVMAAGGFSWLLRQGSSQSRFAESQTDLRPGRHFPA